MSKIYGSPEQYEKKLDKVMARFKVQNYDYNWDRYGAWVQFEYKGNIYRFDHTVEKAKEKGLEIRYGSDAFAQLVLALEDLARIAERGIYDLQNWIKGMIYLPPTTLDIPDFFVALGFDKIPSDKAEVNERYRQLAKKVHPDVDGGSEESFRKLKENVEKCIDYLNNL